MLRRGFVLFYSEQPFVDPFVSNEELCLDRRPVFFEGLHSFPNPLWSAPL